MFTDLDKTIAKSEEISFPFQPLSNEQINEIITILKNNLAIKSINLSGCGLSEESLNLLLNMLISPSAGALVGMFTAAKINLTAEEIKLLDLFKKYNQLKTLNLSHNDMTDKSVRYLRELLENNPSFANLDLSLTNISQAGFNILLPAFEAHPNLKFLAFDSNQNITDIECIAFAKMLTTNKSIQSIAFKRCSITNEGARAMIAALEINDSIQKVDLDFNAIDSKLLAQLNYLVQCNVEKRSKQDYQEKVPLKTKLERELEKMQQAELTGSESQNEKELLATLEESYNQGDRLKYNKIFEGFYKKYGETVTENYFKILAKNNDGESIIKFIEAAIANDSNELLELMNKNGLIFEIKNKLVIDLLDKNIKQRIVSQIYAPIQHIRILLQLKPNLSGIMSNKLIVLAAMKNQELLKLLLESGANPFEQIVIRDQYSPSSYNNIFELAVDERDAETFRTLVQSTKPTLSQENLNILLRQVVIKLDQSSCNYVYNYVNPYIKFIKILLEQGADINFDLSDHWRKDHGNLINVAFDGEEALPLIELIAGSTQQQRLSGQDLGRILLYCMFYNKYELAKKFITPQTDFNVYMDSLPHIKHSSLVAAFNPLHYAISSGRKDLLISMLSCGASPHAKQPNNADADSALQYAKEIEQMVELLQPSQQASPLFFRRADSQVPSGNEQSLNKGLFN